MPLDAPGAVKTLFSPLRLRGATLSNRLVVAPMTTSQSLENGAVSPADLAWFRRLGTDGYGLVISCAAAISKSSIAFPRQLSLASDDFLPGLQELVRCLDPQRTVAIAQLCHGGSRAIPALTGVEAHSASRFDLPGWPGFVPPVPLSPSQIEQIIEDFASASARAAAAGFHGVELHGANGYLFTQFISTMTNRRDDEYGGSLENRARFSRQVVRACRARVPPGFIIGFRLSFEGNPFDTGLDLDENVQVMRWLAEDGIDYGHLSHLDLFSHSLKHPDRVALEFIRSQLGDSLPLIAAGGVMKRQDADRALELGADLVAIGRAAIGNSGLPERLSRHQPLTPPPYSPEELRHLAISNDFVHYLSTAMPISTLGIVRKERLTNRRLPTF